MQFIAEPQRVSRCGRDVGLDAIAEILSPLQGRKVTKAGDAEAGWKAIRRVPIHLVANVVVVGANLHVTPVKAPFIAGIDERTDILSQVHVRIGKPFIGHVLKRRLKLV